MTTETLIRINSRAEAAFVLVGFVLIGFIIGVAL